MFQKMKNKQTKSKGLMLSFPSQNDKKKNSDRPGLLEKRDPGDSKATYF